MKQMLMAAAVAAAGFGLSTLSVAAVGDTSAQATPPAPVHSKDRGDSFFALSAVDTETTIDGGSFSLAGDPETYALLLGVIGATVFVVRRRRQG